MYSLATAGLCFSSCGIALVWAWLLFLVPWVLWVWQLLSWGGGLVVCLRWFVDCVLVVVVGWFVGGGDVVVMGLHCLCELF